MYIIKTTKLQALLFSGFVLNTFPSKSWSLLQQAGAITDGCIYLPWQIEMDMFPPVWAGNFSP